MTPNFLTRMLAALALTGVSLVASGCGPEYDHMKIADRGNGSGGERIDEDALIVPIGSIVTADITAFTDDNKKMGVAVRLNGPAIIEIDSVVNADNFSFVGVSKGDTEIEIVVDGTTVRTIPARVIDEP